MRQCRPANNAGSTCWAGMPTGSVATSARRAERRRRETITGKLRKETDTVEVILHPRARPSSVDSPCRRPEPALVQQPRARLVGDGHTAVLAHRELDDVRAAAVPARAGLEIRRIDAQGQRR